MNLIFINDFINFEGVHSGVVVGGVVGIKMPRHVIIFLWILN